MMTILVLIVRRNQPSKKFKENETLMLNLTSNQIELVHEDKKLQYKCIIWDYICSHEGNVYKSQNSISPILP